MMHYTNPKHTFLAQTKFDTKLVTYDNSQCITWASFSGKSGAKGAHCRAIIRLLEVGRLQVKSTDLTVKRLINLSALCADTTLMRRIRLGGSRGMLPQENFLKI